MKDPRRQQNISHDDDDNNDDDYERANCHAQKQVHCLCDQRTQQQQQQQPRSWGEELKRNIDNPLKETQCGSTTIRPTEDTDDSIDEHDAEACARTPTVSSVAFDDGGDYIEHVDDLEKDDDSNDADMDAYSVFLRQTMLMCCHCYHLCCLRHQVPTGEHEAIRVDRKLVPRWQANLVRQFLLRPNRPATALYQDAFESYKRLSITRYEALRAMHERDDVQPQRYLSDQQSQDQQQMLRISSSSPQHTHMIDVIENLTAMKPLHFVRHYQHGNVPCLIRSCTTFETCFAPVRSKWLDMAAFKCADGNCNHHHQPIPPDAQDHPPSSPSSLIQIDRAWFEQVLGLDTLVPVRYQTSTAPSRHPQYQQQQQQYMDDQGRAQECQTREMPLRQWIQLLAAASSTTAAVQRSHKAMWRCEQAHHMQPPQQQQQQQQQQQRQSHLDDSDRLRVKRSPQDETLNSNNHGRNYDDSNITNANHEHERTELPPNIVVPNSSYYLKDWHLLLWLQGHAPEELPLYDVPEHFQQDLWNDFLLSSSWPSDSPSVLGNCSIKSSRNAPPSAAGGDYRFVYWGPAGSYTAQHADVLHSFSWSYNVKGTKEWTFYLPSLHSSTEIGAFSTHEQSCNRKVNKGLRDEQMTNIAARSAQSSNRSNDPIHICRSPTIVLHQHAGECMFVPAGWQHTVVNLDETLSINHNWITTANLDLTWQCILMEMRAVNNELNAWDQVHNQRNSLVGQPTLSMGNTTTTTCNKRRQVDECKSAMTRIDLVDYYQSRENMLRSCAGMDISGYFLMVLSHAMKCIHALLLVTATEDEQQQTQQDFCKLTSQDPNEIISEDKLWECAFDLCSIRHILEILLIHEDLVNEVQLPLRLMAMLRSTKLAQKAINMAWHILDFIGLLNETVVVDAEPHPSQR